MPSIENYNEMPPLEALASRTIDDAFKASAKEYKTLHNRKHRIYQEIRNFSKEFTPKTDSGARQGLKDTSKSSAVKDKLGLMWALHNTANSIGQKAIIDGEELLELVKRKGSDILFLEDMAVYLEDLFTDDRPDIKGTMKKIIWDVFAGGTVIVASWKPLLKRIRQLQQMEGPNGEMVEDYVESEVNLGAYPKFDQYPIWDAYPTKGATCLEDVHEWIFPTKMPISELREMDRNGDFIKGNLDKTIADIKNRDDHTSQTEEGTFKGERIKTDADGNIDTSTQIEVLVCFPLFPLYKYEKYVDDYGIDRSKDEVECIAIKAKHSKYMLALDRNPFACQDKPVFIGGWYFIPGELFPVTAFEIAEKLILRHEFVNNLIAESANLGTYLTELVPREAGIEEAELQNPNTTGRRVHVDYEAFKDGNVPTYMARPNPVFRDLYAHRDYLYTLIQMVTTIYDYVQGMMPRKEVKATEINAVVAKLNDLFYKSSVDIEATTMGPMWAWMIILLAEFSDDKQIATEMGMVYDNAEEVPPEATETGLVFQDETDLKFYFNPFKQIIPVLPNPDFRIKMTAALRASQTHANQVILRDLIDMGREIPAGPIDDSGKQYAPNITKMFFDLVKMSPLRDTDQYKIEVVPDQVPPEGDVSDVAI